MVARVVRPGHTRLYLASGSGNLYAVEPDAFPGVKRTERAAREAALAFILAGHS
jgi:hypothetical protein